MDYMVKTVALLLLTPSSFCGETYESSTNICQKCTCILGPQFVLDCKEKNIHDSIAEWPQHNTTLIATFSYNNITNLEVLPDSDLVTELVFDHCGIKSLDNGAFKAVKNVRFLDLSYNLLTTEEIAPEKFKGPYNDTVYEPLGITHLNLAYNQIHSLPHNIFEHLTDLRELNIEGNRFKVLDHPTQIALSGLLKLEGLNLANNDLTELVADAVRNLRNLQELDLSYNKLDFVPDTLTLLGETLETVYLDNNLIFELTDESFLGIQGIVELSLSYLYRLKYVNANTFSPLTRLKKLSLSNNPNLIQIDREAFGINQTLNEIYLQNNSLRGLDFDLTKWSSLRALNLKDNDFRCDCNLYKIAQNLSEEITRNRDGPVCNHPMSGRSVQIYDLDRDICGYKGNALAVHHIIEHHFETIKLVLLILLAVFIATTAVAVLIAFLKYRRYRMNQNYPFATQVLYNPLRSATLN